MNNILVAILSGLGAIVGIGTLAQLDTINANMVFLMAPFGATAVLIFSVPNSPLAQPKNVILGHVLTAAIGVLFVEFIGVNATSLAIATGLAVTTMLLTNTTHPPAGANPLVIMLTGQSWSFLLTPVLLGSILLVCIALIMKRIQAKVAKNV